MNTCVKKIVVGVAAALLLSGLAFSASATTLSLNAKVLQFAQSHIGQQVGKGECWDLANEALAVAGARQPGHGGYSTYTFGTPLALSSIRPGDILQFENVNFKHTNPNGSWNSNSFPHHTAVVRSVSGGRVEILQQNVNGDRHVRMGTINLGDRQPGGSLRAYRPHSR
jgi:hypothetical protein